MRILFLVAIVLAACTKKDPLFCEKNPDDSSCGGMVVMAESTKTAR